MTRRPRLIDIAREAGVSLATVDRVLNGRETVRAETEELVRTAARRLAVRNGLAAEGVGDAVLHDLRYGVLLHKAGQEFYQSFAQELQRAVQALPGVRGRLIVEFATSQAPSETARLMRSFLGRVDVLAATSVSHPEVTAAVSDLHDRGLPVFALLSDFAQGVRQGYIGLNNLKVGRIAGWMMATATRSPGKVAVFVGGHRWQGHELRETGFRAYLRESAPHLLVMDTVVNLETRQLTYEATCALLARQPDLRGIFVAGGGMEGAVAALREARRPGDVVMVVNELTSESRIGLAEGWVTLVDATPLPRLCHDLMNLMTAAAQGVATRSGQHFLPPDLHIAESL